MQKLLSIAGALALAMTVTPALAHDDDDYQDTHARAHVEHGDYHEATSSMKSTRTPVTTITGGGGMVMRATETELIV